MLARSLLIASKCRLPVAAACALGLLPASAWAQDARFFFEPAHLGIERTVPKRYNVRLLPPPTGEVTVEVTLGDCAEEVRAEPATLVFTPGTRFLGVTLTARAKPPKEDDENGEGDDGHDDGEEGDDEEEEEGPCANFNVTHRVTATADPRFYRWLTGVLPVGITANRAPQVTRLIPDQAMDPQASAKFYLRQSFFEPDGDPLTFAVSTSNDQAAAVYLNDNVLDVVAGRNAGKALISVLATETQGLVAEMVFAVRVGALVSIADAEATEGGAAMLAVTMARPQSRAVTVPYRLDSDGRAATADADADEYGAAEGQVTLPAGETEATIAIAIADDDVIEPAEETFVLTPQPAADRSYALERSRAVVVVREGVCDRTPPVRDALRGEASCTEPTVAALAGRRALNLAARGLTTLQADDLLGLGDLESIDLSANRLETLPAGLFAHSRNLRVIDLGENRLRSLASTTFAPIANLRALRLDRNQIEALPAGLFAAMRDPLELRLEGNPGAPFPFGLTLTRTDGAPLSPSPATIRAAFAPGVPFSVASALTVENGTASPAEITLAAGAVSTTVTVTAAASGGTRLTAAAPSLPATRCVPDGLPCFLGLQPVASAPLVLFATAPTVQGQVQAGMEIVPGDTLRIPFGEVFAVEDGQPLRYSAIIDPPVASWRFEGDVLLLTADEEAEEGTATVTVTAVGGSGLSASVSFTVTFAPAPTLRSFTAGWRHALSEEAGQKP